MTAAIATIIATTPTIENILKLSIFLTNMVGIIAIDMTMAINHSSK
jgi:hypothetical protein